MMTDMLSSEQVCEVAGVSARQLQWFDEKGVVCPLHIGHRRQYQSHEVLAILVLTEIRRRGLSLQRSRKIIARFLADAADVHKRLYRYLLIEMKGSRVVAEAFNSEDSVLATLPERGPCILVDVASLREKCNTEGRGRR